MIIPLLKLDIINEINCNYSQKIMLLITIHHFKKTCSQNVF